MAVRAGSRTLARRYDLRSTFAPNVLAAAIATFELARIMGTSVGMIEAQHVPDRHGTRRNPDATGGNRMSEGGKTNWESITADDALFWLNDRVGKTLTVRVWFDRGDRSVSPFSAQGTLRHWHELSEGVEGQRREEIRGLYSVGDENAAIDVTELRSVSRRIDMPCLVFDLPGDVYLELAEQTRPFGA
jgi:hypothetical protein